MTKFVYSLAAMAAVGLASAKDVTMHVNTATVASWCASSGSSQWTITTTCGQAYDVEHDNASSSTTFAIGENQEIASIQVRADSSDGALFESVGFSYSNGETQYLVGKSATGEDTNAIALDLEGTDSAWDAVAASSVMCLSGETCEFNVIQDFKFDVRQVDLGVTSWASSSSHSEWTITPTSGNQQVFDYNNYSYESIDFQLGFLENLETVSAQALGSDGFLVEYVNVYRNSSPIGKLVGFSDSGVASNSIYLDTDGYDSDAYAIDHSTVMCLNGSVCEFSL